MVVTDEPNPTQYTATAGTIEVEVEAATETEPVNEEDAGTVSVAMDTTTGVTITTTTTTNPILPEEPYGMIDIEGSNEAQVQAQTESEAPAPAKEEAGEKDASAPTSGSTDPATIAQAEAQPSAEDEPGADAIQIWGPAAPDVLSVSRIVVSTRILCTSTYCGSGIWTCGRDTRLLLHLDALDYDYYYD
jgi:hypothetical protein